MEEEPMEETLVIDLKDTSDIDSVSSSSSCMTSVTDLSIYHEFDCMIAELHAIQEAQHDVLHRLHSIQWPLTAPLDTETLEEEIDELAEFKEAIQQFHLQSLEEIASSLPNTFTDKLLTYLDAIPSDKESEDETE